MAEPEIRTSSITIPVADGTTMGGYLAVPAAPGPPGLGAHARVPRPLPERGLNAA
jgi:hypothetical protein